MPNLTLKQKIMAFIAIIGTILILIFQGGLYSKNKSVNTQETKSEQSQNQDLQVVSTNPSPLNDAIILPTQIIEISFNKRLVNAPEFKHKLEPKVEYKVKLSDDHKTITISPTTTFQLGTTYTLFISSDTKLEGNTTLGKDFVYHFKTIEYRGI